MKRFEIFCKIVDNFGDIGVCWRLAKQLNTEHGVAVRLWVDDIDVAKHIVPELNPALRTQMVANINICRWDEHSHFTDLSGVIVEAFGCDLPQQVTASMTAAHVWVNLEYLSAEPWVEEFHARHSQRGPLMRHFFFPGFTNKTGGLLREQGLVERNRQIAKDRHLQSTFFRQFNLASVPENRAEGPALAVSLFCYPHAPIRDLLSALANADRKTVCYVPASGILAEIAAYFGKSTISPGMQFHTGNMTLHILPFLSQDNYDSLLASCDINFVRGEDSWIRAIWAGKPFIWQPYRQEEKAHMIKLAAFLDTFYADCDETTKAVSSALHRAWASPAINETASIPDPFSAPIEVRRWQEYINVLDKLRLLASHQTSRLTAMPDLASNLVRYVEKLQHNHI